MTEGSVPTQGSTSGWEKGHLICPNCKARDSMQFTTKTFQRRTLDGRTEYDHSERISSQCTACGVKFPAKQKSERVK